MIVFSAAKPAFGAVIAIAIAMSVPAVAEEGTVEAFSSWEARGQIYPTGPKETTFVGVLSGILYVTDETGSMDAGLITCPVTVAINTEDGSQVADGKCVIVTPDGERIYAAFADRLARIATAFTMNPLALALAMLAADGLPSSCVRRVRVGGLLIRHGMRRSSPSRS